MEPGDAARLQFDRGFLEDRSQPEVDFVGAPKELKKDFDPLTRGKKLFDEIVASPGKGFPPE